MRFLEINVDFLFSMTNSIFQHSTRYNLQNKRIISLIILIEITFYCSYHNPIYFTIVLNWITFCIKTHIKDNKANTAFTFTIWRLGYKCIWWSNSISQKHNHQVLMFKRNWNNILFLLKIFQGHLNENCNRLSIDRTNNCPEYPYPIFPVIDAISIYMTL